MVTAEAGSQGREPLDRPPLPVYEVRMLMTEAGAQSREPLDRPRLLVNEVRVVMPEAGAQRREPLDWPPPLVEVDDDGGDFPDVCAAEATRCAVERLVTEVWEQVGRPSRAVLARGVRGIRVRADFHRPTDILWDGNSMVLWVRGDKPTDMWHMEFRRPPLPDAVFWQDSSIVLYVPADKGPEMWQPEIRRLLGTALAHTFWGVHADLLVGGDAAPSDVPGGRDGASPTVWFEAFSPGGRDEESWALGVRLVSALLHIWGIPPSERGYSVLNPTPVRGDPDVDLATP
jgi:hypothetical protein